MGPRRNHRFIKKLKKYKTMTTKTNTPSNEKRNQVITDFGQKIGGAHKDRAREAAARLYGVDAPALIAKPLGQVAKLPDLRALYASGVITEETARRAWYLWSQIGAKPGSARPWRVHEWAEKAAALIAAVADTLAYGVSEKSQLPADHRAAQSWELFQEEMTAAGWPAEDYKRGAYFVGRHWMGAGYSIHSEKSSYNKQFTTVADAVAAIREKVGGAAKSAPRFSLYKTRAGGYFITPEGKAGIKLYEFADRAEALAAYGDTEKLAARYNELRTFPSERRDWNRPRVGEDHRHGQDLSPEAFAAVFPFRGVEFGNWVNQIERAACLNECADALHDLAHVLGIIPEAVTLGGSLAWAFGSRGVGRAAAHYESARRVVNLTKRSGNGCVAHEWFHALDNYLMIEEGRPHFFAVNDHGAYGGTEKSQIQEAARLLKVELLNSQMKRRSDKIDTFKSKPYWGTVVEMAARGFEAFIYYKLEAAGLVNDYLVNFRMIEEYNRPDCYPYPTREEAAELAPYYEAFILAAFGDAERLNGADPEAEAVAYGEAEKSQTQGGASAYNLPTLDKSLARKVEAGTMTIHEAARELCAHGWTNFVDEDYTRRVLSKYISAPAVAASLPMDADNPETSAPTGAAYGEAEKSQLSAAVASLVAQYAELKAKHPEAVALFRVGNFYAAYFEDAQKVSDVCGLIVSRNQNGTPCATFPAHALDTYLPKLVRAGLKVCIVDHPTLPTGTDSPTKGSTPTDAPTEAQQPQETQQTPTAAPEAATGAAYGDSQKSQDFEIRPEVEALRQQARRAGTWTSFDPDKLGDGLIADLERSLRAFESKLPEEVRAEKVAAYIAKWREWLAARSRCISSAITGPARFPVARAQKLNEYEQAAWKRLQDWAEKVVRRCNAEQRLTGWDEVERLTAKAEKLEQLQESMKEANKILRQRISEVEKSDALVALGFSEQEAQEIMTPDYIGRVGFASFQLSNNLAKIKDTRNKIARHAALAKCEDRSVEYVWGTLEYCFSAERYRLHFPGKPSDEILTFLKSHGWKWSRANGAWQRQITAGARYNLKQFIEKFGGKAE